MLGITLYNGEKLKKFLNLSEGRLTCKTEAGKTLRYDVLNCNNFN